MKAKIRWTTAEDGGRKAPPSGPRYSAVARFESEAAKWPHEAWSIMAELPGPPDESLEVIADIHLLAPDKAPAHLLQAGNRFDLFEGTRLVARGEILGSIRSFGLPSECFAIVGRRWSSVSLRWMSGFSARRSVSHSQGLSTGTPPAAFSPLRGGFRRASVERSAGTRIERLTTSSASSSNRRPWVFCWPRRSTLRSPGRGRGG